MQEIEQSPTSTTKKKDVVLNIIVVIGLIALIIFAWQVFVVRDGFGESGSSAIVTQKDDDAPVRPSATGKQPPAPPNEDDHIRGSRAAIVSLIEYADFECPYCKKFHPTMQRIVDDYDGQVNWVLRHFPLSFHPNAPKEAQAAECAAEQGGDESFWRFVDLIFERTTSNGIGFALSKLEPLAGEIGLNQEEFKECLSSGKYASVVEQNLAEGKAAGVTGTPETFAYNNETGENMLISGALPYELIKEAVDQMLNQDY